MSPIFRGVFHPPRIWIRPPAPLPARRAYRPEGRAYSSERFSLMGKKPADRVKTLLGKLDSVRRTQERGSSVSRQSKVLSHKFMGQVEKIFKNLPKPLEWRSFYNNDLPLLIDFCEEVQEISIQHRPWPRPHMQAMNTKTLPAK